MTNIFVVLNYNNTIFDDKGETITVFSVNKFYKRMVVCYEEKN